MISPSNINLSTWAGIIAAGTLIASFWSGVKRAIIKVSNLFICKVKIQGKSGSAIMTKMLKIGKRSPFGWRMFGGFLTYVLPSQRIEVVAYEGFTSDPRLVWVNGKPLVMVCGETEKGRIEFRINDEPSMTLYFIRGTINIEQFISSAITEYNNVLQKNSVESGEKAPKKFRVIRFHGNAHTERNYSDESGAAKSSSPEQPTLTKQDTGTELDMVRKKQLKLLSLKIEDLNQDAEDYVPFLNHPVSKEVETQLLEIGTWLQHENWFRSKGVPWRRGYLLYGPPGGGKSTIVRNVGIKYDLPIYSYDLSSFDNSTFSERWKTMRQNAPAIALLEDIDTVFNGRENVAVKGKNRDGLTFDCLLNTISGVDGSDGVLLFITTNSLKELDPAIGIPDNGHNRSTRPGRIDRVVEIGKMQETERRKVASIILSDWPELIEPTVIAGEGEMAAQFQERCAQIAMLKFWDKNHSK